MWSVATRGCDARKDRAARRVPAVVEALEPRALLALSPMLAQANPGLTAVEVTTDRDGNTYLLGNYTTEATIAPLATIRGGTRFLAKIDANGQGVWIKNMDKFLVTDVAVDATGNAYVLGWANATLAQVLNPGGTYGDTPLQLNNFGAVPAFLVKFDAGGNYQFHDIIVGQQTTSGQLTVDGSGALLMTLSAAGGANSSITLNRYVGTTFQFTNPFQIQDNKNLPSSYVTRVDPSGSIAWMTRLPSPVAGFVDTSPRIAFDGSGNLVVAGGMVATDSVGGQAFTGNFNEVGLYLARLNIATGAVTSARIAAKGMTATIDAKGLAVDGLGNIHLAGTFQGPATVNGTALTSADSSPDAFVTRFGADLAPSGLLRVIGGPGADTVAGLATDGLDQVFVAGSFASPAALPGLTLPNAGGTDVFVARLDPSYAFREALAGGGIGADSLVQVAIDPTGAISLLGSLAASSTVTPQFAGLPLTRNGGALRAAVRFARPGAAIALPATVAAATFPVRWGDQASGGAALYDVYVSVDGGPLVPWLGGTAAPGADYAGADGHTYGFAVVAIDPTGLRSLLPGTPQAVTTVRVPVPVATAIAVAPPVPAEAGTPVSFLAQVAAAPGGGTPTGFVQFFVDGAAFGGPVPLVNGLATSAATAGLAVGNHQVAANFLGEGLFVPSASAPAILTVTAATIPPVVTPPVGPPAAPLTVVGGASAVLKRRKVTGLFVRFGGPVDAGSAGSAGAYRLVTAGRDRRLGTRDDKVVRVARVAYDPNSGGVTLTPRGKFDPALQYRLTVLGGNVRDASGRAIDANGDGQAGGDIAFDLKRNRLVAARRLAAASRRA